MNVPLRRRLQTLLVLFHTLCIALSVSAFFFLCAIPLFWPILIPYMIYCMASKASTNGKLTHRSNTLRSLPVWSLFGSYFPARLHRSQELPPTRKYIFGYHPHGIISHGAFAAFATEALGFSQLFPGITNTLLTLDSNFRIPIYRDYALAMGLASVSKESCENLLGKGGPNKVLSPSHYLHKAKHHTNQATGRHGPRHNHRRRRRRRIPRRPTLLHPPRPQAPQRLRQDGDSHGRRPRPRARIRRERPL